ncbi:miz zinc finger domain-containing protein [Stemphylium lycopersici]|uniref:Miz zinc finger domain-containing protein n=1 Tax=Stemphylium lycopersici TaxID=183478 RepID=A0A364MXT2_STELY|nr:miz zinc finger domain-containing protein [Stemphylium lycopersici]RAR06263.1 miz zinc finger domain-containing protein [Stemphylium lycopersici]
MVPGTRPPPDDATAQTLHYALGNLGGRQKSWMVMPTNTPISPPLVPADLATNPLPFPVRARGRPQKYNVQPLPASTSTSAYTRDPGPVSRKRPHSPTTDATAEPQARRQSDFLPLSNSACPQLPNTATYVPLATAVLPSPTPNEEATNNATRSRTTAFHHARAGHAPESSLAAPYPSTDSQPQHKVLRHRPTHSDQGRPGAPATAMSAPSPPVAPFTHPDFPRNPSRDHSQANPPILGHMQSRSPSFGNQANTHMPSPHLPQLLPFYNVPPSRTPPQQAPFNSPPPSSSRGTIASQPPPGYTVQDCLNRLDGFHAINPVSPDHPRDGHRLAVLRDATQYQDWSYLTMHQYYCMLTNYPDALPADLKNSPDLHHALSVLQDVLDTNETLSPTLVHFFTCERRRCPPLAQELSTFLSISSLTFQRLVFTAFLRSIWRKVPRNALQARYEAHAVALFQENQLGYFRRLAQQHSAQSQRDQHIEFQNCSSKLTGLVQGLEAVLREQGFLLADQSIRISQQQQRFDNATPRTNTHTQAVANNRPVGPHPAQAAIQQSRGRGLVPPVQDRPSLPPRPAPTPQQQKPNSLFPPSRYQQPSQRIPNPPRFALHQAHLRSPILCAETKSSPLYAFHQAYIKRPARLTKTGRSIEQWTFNLSSNEMKMIPRTVHNVMGAPGTRDVNERSKIARLRCVKWKQGEKDPEEHTWAVTDTSWIPFSYFSLNGTPLQARKKLHHGKDLPIDITDLLKEGENLLEATVMARSGDASHLNYLVAIEAVGVLLHESIKNYCVNENRVSAKEVLQSIKNKLSCSGDDGDDDDLSVVQSSITIGLRDPFSQAKMCDIPVRSKACTHYDCFDLEIFLGSRARKGDVSVADQWKCPICASDARPHMLMFDGFNADVKRQLEAQGLADTRHIIFSQDGSWKPKAEVREGVSDDPRSPVPKCASVPPARSSAPRTSIPADVEIIDLSD